MTGEGFFPTVIEKLREIEAEVVIEAFVQKIFNGFPIDPTIRAARAERIRNDIYLFVRELEQTVPGGIKTAELLDILEEEFGDPDFIREIYLRDDTRLSFWSDRTLLVVSACVLLGYLCMLALMKGAEYYAGFHHQSDLSAISSTMTLVLSPLIGVAAYVANWMVSGNRYRIAPFVLISTAAFLLAMTVRVEFDFIERRPIERVRCLATFAIPSLSAELRPIIHRAIVDIDRTGLPPSLTRSRPFVVAHGEITIRMLLYFWLLVATVAIGNFYLMSRLADDLAILGAA